MNRLPARAYSLPLTLVMHLHHNKPLGTVAVPALLCALTGTLLSVGLELMGYYVLASEYLFNTWRAAPFYLDQPLLVIDQVYWGVAFIMSWLVAFTVLDTAQLWRRILIGVMSLMVLLAATPCLVLWGVEWMPITTAVALIWTLCCSLVYGSQHQMPCEGTPKFKHSGVELKVETVPFPNKNNRN